jgi:uncharacterized membrane protein
MATKRTNKIVVRNANQEHKDNISKLDNIALWITDHVGTMGFFLIIFSWTTIWLSWNLFAPKQFVFDPVPACVFWLFISNMIQIFLMPLIMIGQNLQAKHSELRAEATYELGVKGEEQMDDIHKHLEHQDEMLEKILKKLNQ